MVQVGIRRSRTRWLAAVLALLSFSAAPRAADKKPISHDDLSDIYGKKGSTEAPAAGSVKGGG